MIYPLWFVLGFWAVLVITYVFIAGVAYKLFLAASVSVCNSCRNGYSCYSDHEVFPFFIAIVWPLGVPLMLGIKSASKVADRLLDMKAGSE